MTPTLTSIRAKIAAGLREIEGLRPQDAVSVIETATFNDVLFADTQVTVSYLQDDPTKTEVSLQQRGRRFVTAKFVIAVKGDSPYNSVDALSGKGGAETLMQYVLGVSETTGIRTKNIGVTSGDLFTGPIFLYLGPGRVLLDPRRAEGAGGPLVLIRHFETTPFEL
jgi:hypothetical protein